MRKQLLLLVAIICISASLSAQNKDMPLIKDTITENKYTGASASELVYFDKSAEEYISKSEFIKKYGRAEFKTFVAEADRKVVENIGIEPLVYSEVVTVDGASAEDLFIRGRAWFALSYNNAKAVLKMDQNNILIGKAKHLKTVKYGISTANFEYDYNINIECRDGRYRYTIDNISVNYVGNLTTSSNYMNSRGKFIKGYDKTWKAAKQEFNSYQELLILSIKTAMQNKTTSVGDDW